MCLNTGTPKNINFSFETNGKWMALGVPILKQFRVSSSGEGTHHMTLLRIYLLNIIPDISSYTCIQLCFVENAHHYNLIRTVFFSFLHNHM